MIKVLTLCLIVALAFSVSGATCMNSVLNSPAVDFVCQPTPAQIATATAMLAALDAAQAAGAIFLPVLAVAKASAVLKVIATGGCFLVSELKAAFEVVDAGNLALAQKQLKMVPGSASLTVPDYSPLRVLVK